MIAQSSPANIDAVEIDKNAYQQAIGEFHVIALERQVNYSSFRYNKFDHPVQIRPDYF